MALTFVVRLYFGGDAGRRLAETADLGFTQHFDPLFNSGGIGYIKPDVRVFTHVLDHLGLTTQEIFFTDDSENKLRGARFYGMLTHHFTETGALRAPLAQH